jgi:hypothetical protein
MSDPTSTAPRPLKVFTCYDPTGRTKYCFGLVEDTPDTRREHRAWHAHEELVKQGYRDKINDLAEEMRKATQGRDDEIASLRQEVADLDRDVTGIEIPQPVLGIEINRDGYTEDDELASDDSRSPYVDDDIAFPVAEVRADAAAAFTVTTEPDPDDELPPIGAGLYSPGGIG